MASINSLYLLTPMTGRESSHGRTMVFATVEMKMRHFWIGVFAAAPGALLLLITWPLLGSLGVFWIVLTEAAAFFLIEKRSRDGLRLRTFQSLLDKSRSDVNVFQLCGQPVEVSDSAFGSITETTVAVKDKPDEPTFISLDQLAGANA